MRRIVWMRRRLMVTPRRPNKRLSTLLTGM
jgi:hypothetical protein